MIQKKIRLSFDPSDDYRLTGITTAMADYQLAFQLNKALAWDLCRLGTFTVQHTTPPTWFYVYHYQHDDFSDFFLIGNARPLQKMSEPQFLLAKGGIRPEIYQQITEACSALPQVLHTDDISLLLNSDSEKLSSRQKKASARITGIIYDLEIFLMEHFKKKKMNQALQTPTRYHTVEPKKMYTL
ncbi:MAG: IPExxxVDY family protein [Bacteroidales bacterium]|nr:IPExxxVDY family protein [Bacteroidales bacterium]MDD3664258.1 IPExxxVDY family protein [Bacteroidales bacterium]